MGDATETRGVSVEYTVSQIAKLAGISVRTLHHYDEIGLLAPSHRDAAGYRRYTETDAERLARILAYRELELPLNTIREVMEAEGLDALAHLTRQHQMLRTRISRLQNIVTTLEYEMEAHAMGITLTPEERFEVFGEDDPAQYSAEAQQRWGNTEAFRESQHRVSSHGKAQWQQMKQEWEEWEARAAALLTSGLDPVSETAREHAEQHRQLISQWAYECSYQMHTALADMYLADERFTQHYDERVEGLAQFVHDAIYANAAENSR